MSSVSKKTSKVRYVNICDLDIYGLSNQLFFIVGAIIWCIENKISTLLIGNFLLQIKTKYYTNISKILYLSAMSECIAKRYGITLVDVSNTTLNRSQLNKISIRIPFHYCSNAVNSFHGKYIISNMLFFTPDLVSIPMKFINKILCENNHGKINIIHLRMEDDALNHWSKENKMSIQTFHTHLVKKYVKLIQANISSTDTTIVIGGSVNNHVIRFLCDNRDNYTMFVKQSKFREINAIMDMVIGKMCSGIFIGAGGSSFSQIISLSLEHDDRVKRIMFDLNNIT